MTLLCLIKLFIVYLYKYNFKQIKMRHIKTNYSDKYGNSSKQKNKVNYTHIYELTLLDRYYISKKSKDNSLSDYDKDLLKSYINKDQLNETEYSNVKKILY